MKLSHITDSNRKEENTITGCFKKIQESNEITKKSIKHEIDRDTKSLHSDSIDTYADLATPIEDDITPVKSTPTSSTDVSQVHSLTKTYDYKPMMCPVCEHLRPECRDSIEQMSKHIDECLNHKAISEMLKEERPIVKERFENRFTSLYYF